jgi:hypothetical protein
MAPIETEGAATPSNHKTCGLGIQFDSIARSINLVDSVALTAGKPREIPFQMVDFVPNMLQDFSSCSKRFGLLSGGSTSEESSLRRPKIGKRLRRDFADQAQRDPSRFKRLVLRLLKAELPPKPARPRLNHINLALAMRQEGKSWRMVYTGCLPDGLNGDSRQLAKVRLRAAVRDRMGRHRRHQESARHAVRS